MFELPSSEKSTVLSKQMPSQKQTASAREKPEDLEMVLMEERRSAEQQEELVVYEQQPQALPPPPWPPPSPHAAAKETEQLEAQGVEEKESRGKRRKRWSRGS